MTEHRTTPPAFVIFAIVGGLLFLAGGIVTAMTPNDRAVLVAAALAFVLLGAYTVTMVLKYNKAVTDNGALREAQDHMRRSDAALRTRMAHTVREPLAIIVGLSDRLSEERDVSTDERRSIMRELRTNAREVEQALADLALEGQTTQSRPVDGVVLLDDELRSVASAITTDTTFESWLDPTRAWGDSSKVRQVLRTLVSHAASEGCGTVVLKTDRIGGRAQATISGRCTLLTPEGIAALTGNATSTDIDDDAYVTLHEAQAVIVTMGGTLGYAEAMGVSHIVLELPAAPEELGLKPPLPASRTPSRVVAPIAERSSTFASAVALRPERPTASIRFS